MIANPLEAAEILERLAQRCREIASEETGLVQVSITLTDYDGYTDPRVRVLHVVRRTTTNG